ncbi:N-acetylhexosamine 1-kinase [Lachnospiraceae bacterium]|nr:N-acetylhexosamine 1-kinase [Lachnospiraceae bacterium]
MFTFIICFLAGLGAGLGTGFAGMSAAAVISPMLITFLGLPAYEAVGIALASDVLASAVSAYTYGKNYFRDGDRFYRMYQFITDSVSLDMVRTPRDFYESAVAFGNFQALLADYPAATLHETIPDFHNTVKRFSAFRSALEADICGRAAKVQPEIAFLTQREQELSLLVDLSGKQELPLRVTHNDTKLNNIMIDKETGRGICVIDLDTVMPGLSLYDFGDSIRFGANTAAEDETDLQKVSLDLNLYELYVKGYLTGCRGSLTEKELSLLPMGAKLMTMECGMRFLTDYLSGDTYFRIHRPNHNLDRCRTQFALAADMERKWQQMQDITEKAAAEAAAAV